MSDKKRHDEFFSLFNLRRRGLQITLQGPEGKPEFILTVFNRIIEDADEAGESVRLRFRDAGVVALSGDRLERIEWVTESGEEYSIEDMDVVSIRGAAELLGMSRSALASRVGRAHRAGKTTPFFRFKSSDIWVAEVADVKAWGVSLVGVHAKRRRRGSEE
jgi:hypothetical protein